MQAFELELAGAGAGAGSYDGATGAHSGLVGRVVARTLAALGVPLATTLAEADFALEAHAGRPPFAAVLADDTDFLLVPGVRVVRFDSLPDWAATAPAPAEAAAAWARGHLPYLGAEAICEYLTAVVRAFGAETDIGRRFPNLLAASLDLSALQECALLLGGDFTKDIFAS